ncbi:MAG TPA: hypothetical protein VK668_11930 [Mucilaginibacter sp.]|nr:hypothetical protein [Mucilaginibacter sp.]
MKKNLLIVSIFLIVGFLAFWCGRKTANCHCNAAELNEAHFINPKYFHQIHEATFQSFLTHVLRDSLKSLKPPFANQKIDELIIAIEQKTKLRNYIKKLTVDSFEYKIIISYNNSAMDLREPYYLLTKDSCYYMKPLKIVEDLEPDR